MKAKAHNKSKNMSVPIFVFVMLCNGTRFEQAFANSLVFGRSGDFFWIGLHSQGHPAVFHWLGGDKVSYTNWNRDQPGKAAR